MDAEAYKLHTYWTATSKVRQGHAVGPEASCNKIFWSETDLAIHTAALDLLGPEAELLEAGAPGEWLDGYLFSLAGPIYAGTNEIQRNVVAERLLGLPAGLTSWTSPSPTSRRPCARACALCSIPSARPDALRAFELADEEGRVEQSQNRWAVLAELGAPALVVPEAADGLGLSDVDLVGVLEEAGRAGLPEPLLETAALAAPTLAALLPDAAAAAALAALVRDDVSFAVGGIDVTPGGLVSPTEVSADGTLRTPRVVGARDAGLLLLAVRDADSGWQLHGVPTASTTAFRTPTLSPIPGYLHRALASGVGHALGLRRRRRGRGVVARRPRRRRDRGAPRRPGRPHIRQTRPTPRTATSSASRSAASRPSSTSWPTTRVALEFTRPATYRAAWVARHGPAHALPRRLHGQGHGVRRRRPGRPGGAAGPRGHGLAATGSATSRFFLKTDVGAFTGLRPSSHPPPAGARALLTA